LKSIPETAATIGERFGKSEEEMQAILDNMAKKGQIGSLTRAGKQMYMIFPFFPGIYEFQVYRLDKELTELFEEYLPTLMKTVGGHAPAVARTVPINTKIEAETQIQPYEDVRNMIERSKSFRVIECICRKERALEGHACDHTLENCLNFSTEENAYDYFSIGGRIISKEEALKVLEKAGEEGLVHNAFYNVKDGHFSVCNCCPCCCAVLRGAKELGAPHIMAKSNFVAWIDQDTCSECGVCAEERCPMDAIVEDDGTYKVLSDVCIGCGVCTVTCPTESITLIQKPETEQDHPPDNMKDWTIKRTSNRGIELKL
jgi:Fe-S-cluster-containing hydrogenase component 2